VNVSQVANVTWILDGTTLYTNASTQTALYYNSSAQLGVHNLTVLAQNEIGMDQKYWNWTVKEIPPGIKLCPGWNYISVPYMLDDPSVASVMEGVTYDALTYYNAETGLWDAVSTIEPLKAYWINISADAVGTQIILEENLELMMPATPSFIMVYEGWNCIGYTDSTDTLSAELTLASIDDSYIFIVGPWNPATMMYDFVGHNDVMGPISGKHVGTDVFNMNPYEGYWLYSTEDVVLISVGM
jgi:hypothetical protein